MMLVLMLDGPGVGLPTLSKLSADRFARGEKLAFSNQLSQLYALEWVLQSKTDKTR